MKDWDYDERDYVRLMNAYLDQQIDVDTYRRQLFSMNAKRSLLSDPASEIIQKAYSMTDRYDRDLRLADTIEEFELRNSIASSVQQLEDLGYRVDEK